MKTAPHVSERNIFTRGLRSTYLDLKAGALQMRQLLRVVASKYYLIVLKLKEGTGRSLQYSDLCSYTK